MLSDVVRQRAVSRFCWPERRWLSRPCRDATSGTETYAAGRYLDLEENTSGIYDLDFNRAYNPSRAYGGDYSSPIAPAESTLPVPIRAEEKDFGGRPAIHQVPSFHPREQTRKP